MYNSFAEVYDLFMEDVPYDRWAIDTAGILRSNGICGGIVAELGCGTGSLTEKLSALGYDMIGIDLSPEMLDIAMNKRDASGRDILYLCQDMREFELYGTCAAIVSRCDSMNYLQSTRDLTDTLRLVNNYLDPGGLFIFDVNSVHKYRDILADGVFAENRDEGSFIWENDYDVQTRINTYDLTLYIQNGSGSYGRFEEVHTQKAFTLEELKAAAREAGLMWKACLDDDTMQEPADSTERYLIILEESGKCRQAL